jgi:4-hydroxybenzoyl-CoA thioesterase
MLTNRQSFLVEFGHCDPSGIVYNPNYFIWFDRAIHALLASGRISLKTLISEDGVDGIPVVEYKTRFLAPSRWGDELVIESGVAELQRCAFTVQHRILNNDVVAVECTETRVCTGRDAHQSGRPKARPLPEKLVAALSLHHLPSRGE